MALDVTLGPAAIRREVAHHLARLLSNGWLPDGTPALFNPANLAFATPVYSSPIIAAVHAVPGVASVTLTRFGFLDQPAAAAPRGRSRSCASGRSRSPASTTTPPIPSTATRSCRWRADGEHARSPAQLVPAGGAARAADRRADLSRGKCTTLPIRTRAPDDPTIALLDAWATVGDVLGFYLDRIADEGYLTTATQPGSILALASLVGYQPAPGLAAQVYLAYTLAPDPADGAVQFSPGLLFQSVPGPGQQPQTFESAGTLVARPSWNLLAPKSTQPLQASTTSLVVDSTTASLSPNDVILLELAGAAGAGAAARTPSSSPPRPLTTPPR